MDNVLELYRGDSSKINGFALSKTSDYSLFGKGIYLTDSLKIAESYRVKGVTGKDQYTLFNALSENRNTAEKEAFAHFVRLSWKAEKDGRDEKWFQVYLGSSVQKEVIPSKFISKCEGIWTEFKESGAIKINYASSTPNVFSYNRTASSVRAREKQIAKETRPRLEVLYIPNDVIGRITRFHFQRDIFENNLIHAERPITDDSLLRLIRDFNIGIADIESSAEFFVETCKGKTLSQLVQQTKKCTYNSDAWNKLQKCFKPYGIHGFEYNGGIHVGGHGLHRAFNIWDEDYVNNAKVGIIR